ncbi:MAG: alpha/beta hydrolase [Actinomycetota bacterium]|nr:alpha/beta hydrolase [Actinomycetota bacterium]
MNITANGINLNVVVEGEGDPVLLLHGFPDSSRLWRSQIPALVENGYRAIAPDLRGFGDSDVLPNVDDYSIVNVLGDLNALADELEVERMHVVGHDWGAATAWGFASIFPDRTRTLTALSVGHPTAFRGAGPDQVMASWYMFLFQFEGVAEELLRRNDWEFTRAWTGEAGDFGYYVEDLSRPGRLTAGLNWYRANARPESWVGEPLELPTIQAPAMGIWSTGDFALTERQMIESEKHVRGPWRYERIEGASHWIPLDAPEKLTDLLLDFFVKN